MDQTADQLAQHLNELQTYLKQEQPRLAELVDEYRQLDQVAYRMGLLSRSQSYADRVSWWPLIAVLGTFSAGKSTFINDYLEFDLQRTGHQAVDDKFTVVCFAADGHSRTLPGTALDDSTLRLIEEFRVNQDPTRHRTGCGPPFSVLPGRQGNRG